MEQLPLDFLRLVFSSLDAVSLASATSVCKEWRGVGMEEWPKRVRQWQFGNKEKWIPLEQAGRYLELFGIRWQLDKDSLASLDAMAGVEKREEGLKRLRAWGKDCLDVLLAAAQLRKGGPKDGPHVEQAVMAVQTTCAAAELRALLDRDMVDMAHLEHGALWIAQAHAPDVDVFGCVSPYLDLLAAEALARITEMAGNPTNLQAVEVVNQLLFLPRHEAHAFPLTATAPPMLANMGHEAAWEAPPPHPHRAPGPPPAPHHAWALPPRGYGLGLRGNTHNYYQASNSLLHELLGKSGLGIPISLCIVHAAVCQRLGLPVHLLSMPMHVMNGIASPAAIYNGPPSSWLRSSVELARLPPSAFELYLDAFEGGRIKDWQTVVSTFSERMMMPLRSPPSPLNLYGYLARMCKNLLGIHNGSSPEGARAHHAVAQLATTIEPLVPQLWDSRILAALTARDCGDAEEALQRLCLLVRNQGFHEYKASVQRNIDEMRAHMLD